MMVSQNPAPFSRQVRRCGDLLTVTLSVENDCPGEAVLRANLGRAEAIRRHEVENVEKNVSRHDGEWHDIPMRYVGQGRYTVTLPLTEVGVFEFKAYFREAGSEVTVWPQGGNAIVKIEPAGTAADNTIYNAFIRQFGPNISGQASREGIPEAIELLDRHDFTVIPPSGKFLDFASHLSEIIDDLGFRYVQLLPIHPEPSTYARMGRYGSPFAARDFYNVSLQMTTFERTMTPLEQFQKLADEIHGRGGRLLIDFPANHTGWGSLLQNEHPEWFIRNEDGSFRSPGAWGVIWEDLCQLDYSKRELWREMSNVFRHWCRHGVDGFRCDAGYMIPFEAWKYIIASVRQEYPDCVFFLEGLGGSPLVTDHLLAEAGFNWAYSEIFERQDKAELNRLLEQLVGAEKANGLLVNFAETHDNNRLAARSPLWAAMRTALAALTSVGGGFGIANGVEWLATEKIDVHGATSLNWGARTNLRLLISKLNNLLKYHPAFAADACLRIPVDASGTAIGLLRTTDKPQETVMVVVNPYENAEAEFGWNFQEFNPGQYPVDLLSRERCFCQQSQCQMTIRLRPAQFVCLAYPESLNAWQKGDEKRPSDMNQWQNLKATALDYVVATRGYGDVSDLRLTEMAETLYRSPQDFFRMMVGKDSWLPYLEWQPGRDGKRVMVVPEKHFLLVRSAVPFLVRISDEKRCFGQRYGIKGQDGTYFAMLPPVREVRHLSRLSQISYRGFGKHGTEFYQGSLLYQGDSLQLPFILNVPVNRLLIRHCALATNELGGYALVRGAFGELYSKYDALLAASLCPDYPTDRVVVLRRFRVWLVQNGFSCELNQSNQTMFAVMSAQSCRWNFAVPSGVGHQIMFQVDLDFERKGNAVTMAFTRLESAAYNELPGLPEAEEVELLVRPDLDWVCNHQNTMAKDGAEKVFPNAVKPCEGGFTFAPYGQTLRLVSDRASFRMAPEWRYNLHFAGEAERGLPDSGDVFSPGFFRIALKGREQVAIAAEIVTAETAKSNNSGESCRKTCQAAFGQAEARTLRDYLAGAVGAFLARRGNETTVIAGFPWFLDWGRDTLICLRGIIAGNHLDTAAEIIRCFAGFEENGTIPNVINGQNVANRETSDAPLWLFVATRDYIIANGGDTGILSSDCRGRSLLSVLQSIVANYRRGTPNGIRVCEQTGLVFSPAHFTWMDTNYPAGTPREGYPVEIQALWLAALDFLDTYAPSPELSQLRQKARSSFLKLFVSSETVGLSDCLHAAPGESALRAVPDDHCRPNQLLAVTLGAVEDFAVRDKIVRAVLALLVPGALRSLADQPVDYRLPISWHGKALNDPRRPFWGNYTGDEDTRRKPAYHNGTAWNWQLPLLAEAMLMTYGESARPAAGAFLSSIARRMREGCLGHLPEIMDGNAPHEPKGCCAQAWSETEALRLLLRHF